MLKNLTTILIALPLVLITGGAFASHVQGHDQEARGWLQQLEERLGGLEALAGQRCPPGEVMIGFDANLNILCTGSPTAAPILTAVSGPFFDLNTFICLGELACEAALAPLAEPFPRFEVFGTAEPGSQVTVYLSSDCSPGTEAFEKETDFCPFLEDPVAKDLCGFGLFTANIGRATASATGDFTASIAANVPSSVSATAIISGQAQSACSNSLITP